MEVLRTSHVVVPIKDVDVAVVVAGAISEMEVIVGTISSEEGWINHSLS